MCRGSGVNNGLLEAIDNFKKKAPIWNRSTFGNIFYQLRRTIWLEFKVSKNLRVITVMLTSKIRKGS